MTYSLRLRSCRPTGAITRSPLPSMLSEALPSSGAPSLQWRYPPSALPRAPPPPSRLPPLSQNVVVIGRTLLHHFRSGTRRASPVARRVLAIVPSLLTPPECFVESVRLRRSILPSPYGCGLGPWGSALSRPPCVHFRYGPMTRSPPHGWSCRWASGSWSPATPPSTLRSEERRVGKEGRSRGEADP